MEKKILLKMLPSKDITLSIEGGETLIISKQNRQVKANDVYELLDFSRGDKYTVESENEAGVDEPVLLFFKKLMEDIVKKLNKIADSDNDEYLE